MTTSSPAQGFHLRRRGAPPGFFRKGEEESLNLLLHEYGIDRVVLIAGALFDAKSDDPVTREAQRQSRA
ncbi:MAG: hypothetical protein U1F68_08870 [Gammaproteobacteria bacterium]